MQASPEIYQARFIQRFQESKEKIDKHLEKYDEIDTKNRDQLFEELAFCLLTPQSKARAADQSIKLLTEHDLLLNGNPEQLEPHLKSIRFHITKAKRIVEAREKFQNFDFDFDNIEELRHKIVQTFKGLGYKEASHYLRNIGHGRDLAILDRHILKNLINMGLIEEIPKTLTPKKYFEIENTMKIFCKNNEMSMGHIDLILWSTETGEMFK
ncbi:MAG: DNA lyase [uncultured DHVE6 group euryarchaeote]|jgi:N-glycosylase/DNA lyase|nr:N-glycosylase/DNA lyase [Candidatus Woesearchaeota archaeon]MBT6023015.1 N-glycosylase/DNA lyase [Candidatus Woesearchaeota archaeon]RZD30435.1 MAG: DNA lyase [uncultured DHVE6 group euryarchaeote]